MANFSNLYGRFSSFLKSNRYLNSLIRFGEKFHLDTVIFLIVSLFIIVFYWEASWLNLLGIVFVIGGFFVSDLGVKHLGSSYQTLPEAKNLVTSGIYSKIRHPVYVGGILGLLGLVIYTIGDYVVNLVLVILLIVLILIQFVRAKHEEKVLEKRFGKEYIKYKNKTWF